MQPILSIVTLSWNSLAETEACLRSLFTTVATPFEVIVVDNNSVDGSIEMLRQLETEFTNLRVQYNSYNSGYALGNMQAYALTTGKYILALNSDTVVQPGAIDAMVGYLDATEQDATAGAVSTSLREPDGSVQYYMHRRFPTAWRLALSALHKRWRWFTPPAVKQYLYLNSELEHDTYLEQAAGACIMVRRSVLQDIGGLFRPELFPLYYNDVDLSYRLHSAGYTIRYLADAKIIHYKGTSVRKLSILQNGLQYSYAALWFFKANHQLGQFWLLRLLLISLYTCITIAFPVAYVFHIWKKADASNLRKTWHVILTLKSTYTSFAPK